MHPDALRHRHRRDDRGRRDAAGTVRRGDLRHPDGVRRGEEHRGEEPAGAEPAGAGSSRAWGAAPCPACSRRGCCRDEGRWAAGPCPARWRTGCCRGEVRHRGEEPRGCRRRREQRVYREQQVLPELRGLLPRPEPERASLREQPEPEPRVPPEPQPRGPGRERERGSAPSGRGEHRGERALLQCQPRGPSLRPEP